MDFRITAVHDKLLRGDDEVPFGLYHLHLLTAEQFARLHYSPRSVKYVQKELAQLVDSDVLQSDSKLTKRGTGRFYYTLGMQGFNYLRKAGLDVHDSFRAAKEVDKSALFLEHTLELNDVLIAAAKLHQTDPRYQLETLQHDRLLKRDPILVKVGNKTIKLIPDAFLYFGFQGKHLPLYVEHDRSTEQEQHFKRRIRVYIEGIKSGAIQKRFGVRKMTVAFTTFVSEQRLQQMRTWTAEELARESPDVADVFSFAYLPKAPTATQAWLEPCWYLVGNAPPHALLAA